MMLPPDMMAAGLTEVEQHDGHTLKTMQRIYLSMKALDRQVAALQTVAERALDLCNGGIDESRPDGMHLFDAGLVKALNDALDAWLDAEDDA